MGIDSGYGIGSVKPGVCTSTTRPASPFDGQTVYMTDVDQTAVWDGMSWVVLAPISANRNVLENGAFEVWQRGTSIAGLNNSPSYAADRWNIFRASATNYTLSRQTVSSSELPGFNYCGRYQRNAGDTSTANMYLIRTFESIKVKPLAGKNIVLSFYARKGSNYSGGNLNTTIDLGTGTDTGPLTTPGSVAITSTSFALTTSWQRFFVTASVASTVTAARVYIDYVPSGTAGANDWFEITGAQLETGSVPTPFEFEDYSVTLTKCQRYFEKSSNSSAAVGNSMDLTTYIGSCWYVDGWPAPINIPFKVPKRTTPTITFYGPSGQASGWYVYSHNFTQYAARGTTLYESKENSFIANVSTWNGSSGTLGFGIGASYRVEGAWTASAEL